MVIVPVSCPSLGPEGWELSLSFCPHHPAGCSRCSKIYPKWTVIQLRELPAKVERPGEGFSGVRVRQHGSDSETHDVRGNRTSSALGPASCLDGVSQGREGASVRLPEVERQARALGGTGMAEAGMGRCTGRPRALQGPPPLRLQLSENVHVRKPPATKKGLPEGGEMVNCQIYSEPKIACVLSSHNKNRTCGTRHRVLGRVLLQLWIKNSPRRRFALIQLSKA